MFQNPELVISKELHDLLYTDTDCTPLNMPVIHKKYRRDSEGNKVSCPSCNPTTISGRVEGIIGCPYCNGDGYLWDEKIITGWLFQSNLRSARDSLTYPTPAGYVLDKEIRLVTMPPDYVEETDIIYRIRLNKDKNIDIPIKRYSKLICFYSQRMTSDQSNSEFNIAALRL